MDFNIRNTTDKGTTAEIKNFVVSGPDKLQTKYTNEGRSNVCNRYIKFDSHRNSRR